MSFHVKCYTILGSSVAIPIFKKKKTKKKAQGHLILTLH